MNKLIKNIITDIILLLIITIIFVSLICVILHNEINNTSIILLFLLTIFYFVTNIICIYEIKQEINVIKDNSNPNAVEKAFEIIKIKNETIENLKKTIIIKDNTLIDLINELFKANEKIDILVKRDKEFVKEHYKYLNNIQHNDWLKVKYGVFIDADELNCRLD